MSAGSRMLWRSLQRPGRETGRAAAAGRARRPRRPAAARFRARGGCVGAEQSPHGCACHRADRPTAPACPRRSEAHWPTAAQTTRMQVWGHSLLLVHPPTLPRAGEGRTQRHQRPQPARACPSPGPARFPTRQRRRREGGHARGLASRGGQGVERTPPALLDPPPSHGGDAPTQPAPAVTHSPAAGARVQWAQVSRWTAARRRRPRSGRPVGVPPPVVMISPAARWQGEATRRS